MIDNKSQSVAIIVAHPDDETLWAGGTILNNPLWQCFVVCLCRKNDTDRAPKFYRVLKILNSEGIMGDLNDGPDQYPLREADVEQAILDLLPQKNYDLVITHNPKGEYTKHLRHEEISKAVISLWKKSKIKATALWTFAYEDGNKKYFPKADDKATFCETLTPEIWRTKYNIMTDTYGFSKKSWEAQTTPKIEAFNQC